MADSHKRLAAHLQKLAMGYPFSDQLLDLLKELYSKTEAEVLLAVSNNLLPLELDDLTAIQQRASLPGEIVRQTLERLAARNLIYSGLTSFTWLTMSRGGSSIPATAAGTIAGTSG